MGFLLMKLVKPFFLPPTLLLLGFIVSLFFLCKKNHRWAFRVLLATTALYYLLSIAPTAYLFTHSLERQYSAGANLPATNTLQAIVILAGGASGATIEETELTGSSWRRLWKGVSLHQQLNESIPIFYSGGSGDPFQTVSLEAAVARLIAQRWGVREDNFFIDDQSRNTAESGPATLQWLQKQFPGVDHYRIALVTSAWHLPRSVRVFSAQGIEVIPVLADTKAPPLALTPLSFFPSADYFSTSLTSIHEWVGIMGYRLAGWIH